MRDLKFRAWNGKSFAYYGIGMPIYNVNRFHVSEYTGMQDKNGKDIYENDIIHLENWNEHQPYDSDLPVDEERIVFFKDGAFNLVSLDGINHCTMSYMNHKFAEVVGNIHQNPDVLKILGQRSK